MNRFKKACVPLSSFHVARFRCWSNEPALSSMQGLAIVRVPFISDFLRTLGDTAIAAQYFLQKQSVPVLTYW